jgi:ABC-2 type transport system permease protein
MTRRALTEAIRGSAQRVIAAPGGLGVSLAFYLVIVGVLSGLWRVAVDHNGGDLAGYTAVAITWYIITSEAATVAIHARLIADVGDDIGSGAVAVELLRPASVLGVRVASEVGRTLPKLAILWVAGGVLATLVAGAPPQPMALLLAAPSLVLAVVANLIAQHAAGGAAFWLRDAGSAWFLYLKAVFILGGMIIPLELLPDALERVALFLPFRAMAYAPARLASGHVEPVLLLEQAAWIVVLTVLAVRVYSAGERRLQVVGG